MSQQLRLLTADDLAPLARRLAETLDLAQLQEAVPAELPALLEKALRASLEIPSSPPEGTATRLLLEAWLLQPPPGADPDNSDVNAWPRRFNGGLLLDRLPVDRSEIQNLLRFLAETGAEIDQEPE